MTDATRAATARRGPAAGDARGDRRARRRAARRDDVLAAALRVLAREGLDGLTMQALAAEVDCAVGALYRYFPGKAAVLVALQEQAIGVLAGAVGAAVEAERVRAARARDGDAAAAALARVVAALRPVLELPARDPDRHRLIDALLSAPDPVLAEADLAAVNAALAPLLDRVGAVLHEAALAGALAPGDPAARTRLLWAALHGLDHFRKRDRAEPPALRVARLAPELVRALLVGFGADPARAYAALAGGLGGRPRGAGRAGGAP